jgi:CheY-like chemotaxis protein
LAEGGLVVGVEVLEGIELVLVDDEPGILRALSLLLGSLKCKVSAHSSPMEALTYLGTGARPDAIISDLRMPGMTGMALLQHLRASGDTTPFVLMSGHANSDDIAQARAAGIASFLGKPFPPQDLLKVLVDLCPRVQRAANGG